LKAIFASRQLFDPVLPMATGKNDHRDPGIRVLSLDERTLKGRAIRTLHGSSNRRSVAQRPKEK